MKEKLVKVLHIKGLRKVVNLWLVNHIYAGDDKPQHFEKKRKLLISIGIDIGEGTKIVGSIYPNGQLIIGKDCWIGKNFMVNGIGKVTIGDNCDIAPEVIFQTGGHYVGDEKRRAGEGVVFNQSVGSGTWIGGRSTILNNTIIGNSCVIAGGSCVVHDVSDNMLVGGVPAKIIRKLEVKEHQNEKNI